MGTFAEMGYNTNYSSANQLLSGSGNVSMTSHNDVSCLSNDNSLSPSGASNSNSTTVTQSSVNSNNDVLSPGAISPIPQTSSASVPPPPPPLQPSSSSKSALPSPVTAALSESVERTAENSVVTSLNNAIECLSSNTCCDNGRPIMTDPLSGQSICSCQYDSTRLALTGYSRMPSASVGVYGMAYPSNDQNPYPSISVESSAFYTPLSNPYNLKESSSATDMSAWTSAGLQPTTGYYSYDPTFAYGYGPSYDLAARRKNATRESTATLKAWLSEHKKNPYPTKGEKIMLAIITKMTLTQVSTWFANARRRLKKENKMTWEPKNKTEDDDEALLSEEEKDCSEKDDLTTREGDRMYGQDIYKEKDLLRSTHQMQKELNQDPHKPELICPSNSLVAYNVSNRCGGDNMEAVECNNVYNDYHQISQQQQQQQQPAPSQQHMYGIRNNIADCGIPLPASKPKIWSLADTVTCKSPPARGIYGLTNSLQQQQQQQQQQSNNNQQHSQPQQQQNHVQQHSSYSYYNNNNNNNNHNNTNNNNHNALISQARTLNPQSALSAVSNYVQSAMYNPNQITNYNGNMLNHPQQQQQQQQQPLQQYPNHSRILPPHLTNSNRLGFSDIQPDTPPQTPPNMKPNNNNIHLNVLMHTLPHEMGYGGGINNPTITTNSTGSLAQHDPNTSHNSNNNTATTNSHGLTCCSSMYMQ